MMWVFAIGSILRGAAAPARADTVADAFPPPDESARVSANDWGEYVRHLPLKPAGARVHTYDGQVVEMPAARVVDLPLGKRDLQQCADSALRLRATFLRASGVSPAFHYTSGWLSRWESWAAGTRPVVRGNTVATREVGRRDASDAAFDAWLDDLFTYAGTRSLVSDTVPVTEPLPGDLVMFPGSPGHAVVLLDVATQRTQSGRTTWVLAGQGYMPAMEFHVVRGPEASWYRVEGEWLATEPLRVPWSGLRRFKETS